MHKIPEDSVEIPSKPEEPLEWRLHMLKMRIKRLQGVLDDYEGAD